MLLLKGMALPFRVNTLWGIMLSEISQTQKDKFCTIFLIYGILKKKTQNTDTRLVISTGKVFRGVGKMGERGHPYSNRWELDLWKQTGTKLMIIPLKYIQKSNHNAEHLKLI